MPHVWVGTDTCASWCWYSDPALIPVIYMQGFGLRQVLLAFKFPLKMILNCVLTL